MRIRDQLPRRIANPLERVQTHIARRAGASDPVRERRKRRAQDRQPILEPGLPSEIVDLPGTVSSLSASVASLAAHTHTVTVTQITTNLAILAGTGGSADVICQGATNVCGGGVSTNGALGGVIVHSSLPILASNGWRAAVFNNTGGTITMTVWALCFENPIA